jgi:Spy/CpxP family protein refolding chaperone
MTFKPKVWYPIAVVLSVVNVLGAAQAAGEPWLHAGAHAVLAVGFAMWAQRLKHRRDRGEGQTSLGAAEADRMEALEDELTRLRQELSEAQERLDFTERMLAQRPDPRRVEPRG